MKAQAKLQSGLPDGLFSYQKSQFGYIFGIMYQEKSGNPGFNVSRFELDHNSHRF
jgi:hypothetical protein